jgi:DNA-binding response OmpR family regulator
MVADDDVEALGRSASALENAGFRVVSATDGRTALQEALTRKVDLIIMDVSIPQLSGVETCHCLKAMPKTQKSSPQPRRTRPLKRSPNARKARCGY